MLLGQLDCASQVLDVEVPAHMHASVSLRWVFHVGPDNICEFEHQVSLRVSTGSSALPAEPLDAIQDRLRFKVHVVTAAPPSHASSPTVPNRGRQPVEI